MNTTSTTATMTSSVKDLVQEGLQDFSVALHSTVPLRHFSEFHDDTVLNKLSQEQGKKILGWFMRKKTLSIEQSGELIKELGEGIQEMIVDWGKINEDNRALSSSILRKRVDMLSQEFKTSVDMKLLLSEPDMELNELDLFLESRRSAVIALFDGMCTFGAGDVNFQAEYKTKLEGKLECLRKAFLEKQSLHLKTLAVEKAKLARGEVKKVVLEMTRQLRSKVEAFQEPRPVAKLVLKELVEDVKKYLLDCKKGKLSGKHHLTFICELLGTLFSAIKSLDRMELGESIPKEKAMEWADGLERKLKGNCNCNYSDLTQEAGITGNKNDEILPMVGSGTEAVVVSALSENELRLRASVEPEPDQEESLATSFQEEDTTMQIENSGIDDDFEVEVKFTVVVDVDTAALSSGENDATATATSPKRNDLNENTSPKKDLLTSPGKEIHMSCNHCGLRFHKNSNLMQHLHTHTGKKPFKCPTCGKEFSHKWSLSVHARTHATRNADCLRKEEGIF